ncbi:hypothetical protein JMJ77_0011013 [Colletotrichum scovillei]|uniref:Uncharacterized protein n=1 Tax=Colletotrichum scovillei TaxID=1209932 RepID=A0A9P7R2P0_9PEZI|nr:hypothetical protein JMJ77_0011013 [Colletotrichum scovillei]KAG7059977.1 hypothetical protein JMJ78_0015261 [Colletotrichum scovillei]KAG7067433.1 hypothetical protein JMJ76_0008869 [Colletotrichum scovillei]
MTARHKSPKATDGPLSGYPFALIPAASYSALAQLYHLVRLCIGDQCRLARLLSHSRQSGLAPAAGALVDGGYARSFAVVVFAVLVNHVRRMLAPALGVGAFGGPIATLKLAVGSPALFLKEEIEVGFFGRVFTRQGASKLLGDVIGTVILQRVLIGSASELNSINRDTNFRPDNQRRSRSGIGLDGVRTRALEKRKTAALVFDLVWILGCAEYLHARVAHVVAVGIAYFKLLRGGLLHKQALREVVLPFTSPNPSSLIDSIGETLNVVGFHLELVCFIAWGLYPLLRLATGSTLRMDPRKSSPELAMLIAAWAWGTGYVTRYSNKYYIGLEMSGLLLVMWWVSAIGVLLGCHFFFSKIRSLQTY